MHVIQKHRIDLLEICTESVKVYIHCFCEISQRSESNCPFETNKIKNNEKEQDNV